MRANGDDGPDEVKGDEEEVEETNLSLLSQTQNYLRSILDRQVPDTLLSEAWDRFYDLYDGLVRRYVASRQIPATEVEDCVQEVWMAVARGLSEFQHPRQRPGLRAWLFTLVRCKSADVLRRRSRSLHEKLSEDELAQLAQPADDEGHRGMWRRLLVEALLDDVRQRESEENRKILEWKLFEGRRTGEIAERLGLEKRAVRYRFQCMLKKLRYRISVYTGESETALPGG
jgi:RNA polymerase sigma factor (sigma-70 family)